ncbi:MAG: 5-formyltetrahydrofolate cyclo-ligase [Gemmatimonadota bacterium]
MTTKTQLRWEALDRLKALTPESRGEFGARIAHRLWSLPELDSAGSVLLYASLPEEVPTEAIATEARRRGIEVVYPRCIPEGREMTLHTVASAADLNALSRYGTREPAPHCPTTRIGDIDVAIIPGLAWDRAGHRLGRGAGYYDRILASPEWRALRCGLFFSTQEASAIPMDEWDRPLDVVVTEAGIVDLR